MTFPRLPLALLVLSFGTPAGAGVNTWTPTGPDGGDAAAVAFHPSTPGTVFTVSGGVIYRSTNFGQSWTVVHRGGRTSVGRIVIDPSNPSRVMAVSPGNALVYRSDDGGLSFASALAPASTAKLAIATDGSALYLSTLLSTAERKVFRSGNFGATWEDRSQGLPTTNHITDLVVDPANADTVYALIESLGLYKSVDGGVSWTLKNALTGFHAAKVAVDPGLPTDLLLAGFDAGLQASHDGGATWAQEHAGRFMWVGYHPTVPGGGAAVALAPLDRAAHRASRGGPWLDGQQLKVATVEEAAFDPTNLDVNNSTLLVATTEGPLLTQDSGTSFAVRSQGLRGATVTTLVAAGGGQPTMYAGFSAGPVGFYRHTATGWTATDNAELKDLLMNPLLPQAIGADFANSDTLFVAVPGIMRSLDGGQSWVGPLPTGFVLSRSISFAPSNSQVIYAGTDNGVYRSDNGGVTWSPASNGLPPADDVSTIVVDPNASGTVYAALHFPQGPPVLFKTTDAGALWAPATTGLDLTFVEALAIDPLNTQVLYAGGALSPAAGLFKSIDAGQSWQRIPGPNGSTPVRSIAVDPVVPTTLFKVNTGANDVGRSVDGGATWELLATLPSGPLFERLALDPAKPYTVVAALSSDGLYELEVSPDLETTLTAVPPAVGFGSTASATVTVKNRGPLAASPVKVTVSLPLGTTAAVPIQSPCAQVGSVLECSLGAVRAAQQVDTVVTFTAGMVPSSGTLTATATGHESDPAAGNNTASAAIAVERVADLGVTLTPSAAAVDHQTQMTLTAVAANGGPNSSAVAQLTIDLGAGLTFQSANPSQGTCTNTGATVTCDLGVLAAAAQATVAVATTASGIGALTPSAQVSSSARDPAAGDNSVTASVTSRPVANAGVQLSDAADPVVAGQPLQYTATVTNAGPDDLVGSTVTITLSTATASTATSSQGTCTTAGANVTCALNTLPKDGTATININAVANVAGTVVANAVVAHAGTDTDAANNNATQSTTVNAPPSSGGGGGGGGGGAGGPLELLALIALCLVRAKRLKGMRVRRGLVLAASLMAAVALVPAEAQTTFKAPLSWVPIGGAERSAVAGEGSATATLSGSRLSITGSFEGLPAKVTGAKLLQGVAKGARGASPAAIAEVSVTGDTRGTLSGDVPLSAEQVEALKAGQLYLQIYSEQGVLPDHSTLWGWLASEAGSRR